MLGCCFEKLEPKINDGMGRVEGPAIKGFGDVPVFPVEAKGVVAGKEIRRPRKMAPVFVKAKVSRLLSEVPFADHVGDVTGGAQYLGNGGSTIQLGSTSLVAVETGQERDSGRGALSRVVELGEPQAVIGQFVQVGSLDFAAVATDVRKTEIIGHDQNDVRAISRRGRVGAGSKECGEQQDSRKTFHREFGLVD